MSTQNSINNTVVDNNFTVPSGTITTSGDITSSAGNIASTLGSLDAGTTVTAGTGLTVTTNNADILVGNLNVGTAAPANPYDISIEKAVNGLIGISVQNTSAGGNAGSTLQLINEAATGDPSLLLNVNGVSTFSIGIDNGDSDNLKITTGASPSTGTEVLIASTIGALTMNGGQVDIGTNNAASAINIGQGTTARILGIGNSAAPHTLTLGSVDTTATTTLQSGTTGLSVTATNGPLTINSGTGALGISTDAAATTVSFATGGAVKSVTLGSTNTTSATTVQSGSGALNITATGGALTINSGVGALSVSNDAAAATVNIATGGAVKTVTLGSSNTTSSTTINCGTGGASFGTTANAHTTTIGSTNTTSATTVQSGSGGIALNTGTNSNITLAPNGSGIVSVTTAPIVPSGDRADSLGSATNSWDNVYCDGISFDDGTNVLSSYIDNGTWTPVLSFAGGTTGITYTTQTGTYVRIGRLVFIYFIIVLSNKGSSVGAVQISGLPIAPFDTVWIGVPMTAVVTMTDYIACRAVTSSIITVFDIRSGTSVAALTNTQLANTSQIGGHFFYQS